MEYTYSRLIELALSRSGFLPLVDYVSVVDMRSLRFLWCCLHLFNQYTTISIN